MMTSSSSHKSRTLKRSIDIVQQIKGRQKKKVNMAATDVARALIGSDCCWLEIDIATSSSTKKDKKREKKQNDNLNKMNS